jgi:acyl-CoA thioesterase FadM
LASSQTILHHQNYQRFLQRARELVLQTVPGLVFQKVHQSMLAPVFLELASTRIIHHQQVLESQRGHRQLEPKQRSRKDYQVLLGLSAYQRGCRLQELESNQM